MQKEQNIMKIDKIINTSGDGLWSETKRKVKCTSIDISEFEELRVGFDTESWNIETDGLIYTDKGWLSEFRNYLQTFGFSPKAVKDVDYSEQGMQGDDYVSLDIGKSFLKEWNNLERKSK